MCLVVNWKLLILQFCSSSCFAFSRQPRAQVCKQHIIVWKKKGRKSLDLGLNFDAVSSEMYSRALSALLSPGFWLANHSDWSSLLAQILRLSSASTPQQQRVVKHAANLLERLPLSLQQFRQAGHDSLLVITCISNHPIKNIASFIVLDALLFRHNPTCGCKTWMLLDHSGLIQPSHFADIFCFLTESVNLIHVFE